MKKPREDPWKKVNGGEMPVSSGGRRTNSDTCSQVTNSSTESNQPSLSNEKKNAIMLHENQQKQKGHMEMVDAGGGEQQPQQQLANTPLAAILAKLSPEQQHAIVSSILQMNASPHSRSAPNSQTGGSMVYGPPPKSGSSSAPSSSVGSSSKGTPLQQPPAGPPPLLPLQMQMNPLMGPLNGGHHHLPHMLPAQMPAAAAYIQCCLNQMMADQKMSQNQFLTFLQLQQQLQQQKSLHAFAAVNQQQQQWLQLHHLFQNAKLQQPNFPSMVHSNNAAQHLPLQTEGMQQQNPVKKRQKKREQQPSAEKAAAKGTVKRRSSCQSQISNATASTLSQPQPASNDSSGGRMQGSENEEKKQKQTWRSDACEVTSAGNSKRMPPKKTRRLSTDNDGCAAVSPPAEGSGSAMLNGGPSCTSSSVPQQHSVSADSISPSSGGSSSPAELEDAGNAYACQWMRCQDEFATDKQFVEHVNEHVRNEQTPHFYCRWSSCKRKEPFSAQYMLSQHVRKHSGEKPYQCEYVDPQGVRCMKRYSRLENKKTHERTHNGERPYKCKHCPKQFTNASDKAKHENRTHKDTKDFHCPVLGCIKQYTDPSSLRKHVFHEHGEPVWKFAKAMKEDKQSKTYGVNIIGVREDGTPYLIPPGTINNNHVQCSSDEDRDVDVEGDEEQQQAMDMMSAGDMGGGWTHGGGGNHDTTGSGTTQHSHQKQFKQEVASPPSGEGVTSTQRATAHHHSAAGQQQGISMAGLHLQHGSHYSNGPTSHQPFRQQQQQHFLQQRAIKLGSPVTQQVGGGRQPPMKMTAKMESPTQQQQRSMPAVAPLSDHRQHFGTEQQFRPPFHHQQIPVRQHFRRNSNQYSALDQFSPEDPKPGATATAAAPIQHFYEPMKPVRMEGYWPAAANNDAYMDNGGVAMFGAAGPMEYGSGGEMVMAVRPAAASAPRQYPSMKGNYCVDIEANDNAAVAGSVAVMGNPPPSAPPQLQPYPADCQQPPTLQLRPLYHYGQHRYQHQQQPMYQNEGTAIATHHGEHASLQQNFYAAQQQHHHPPHYSHLPLPGPARMAAQPHGHGEMGALESEEEEDSSDEGREGDQLSERLFTECKISDKKGNSG